MTAKQNPRRNGKETTAGKREGAAMIHDSARARARARIRAVTARLVNTLSRFENQRSRLRCTLIHEAATRASEWGALGEHSST